MRGPEPARAAHRCVRRARAFRDGAENPLSSDGARREARNNREERRASAAAQGSEAATDHVRSRYLVPLRDTVRSRYLVPLRDTALVRAELRDGAIVERRARIPTNPFRIGGAMTLGTHGQVYTMGGVLETEGRPQSLFAVCGDDLRIRWERRFRAAPTVISVGEGLWVRPDATVHVPYFVAGPNDETRRGFLSVSPDGEATEGVGVPTSSRSGSRSRGRQRTSRRTMSCPSLRLDSDSDGASKGRTLGVPSGSTPRSSPSERRTSAASRPNSRLCWCPSRRGWRRFPGTVPGLNRPTGTFTAPGLQLIAARGW